MEPMRLGASMPVTASVPSDLRVVPFDLRVVRDGTGVVLRLSGDFDLAAYGQFEAAVRDLQWDFSELVIDLGEVTLIDSSGLRSVVAVWRRSQRDDFELTIVRGPVQVQRMFDLTFLSSVMPLVD